MQYIYYHIKEIKLRFVYCLFSFLLTLLVSYFFQYQLLYLVTRPVIELQQKFIFLDLTEALSTIIRVCFCVTIMVVIPYIVYHIWSFLIPSCYTSERLIVNSFIFFFFILTILELSCIYFFIFPFICEFLSSFQFHDTLQMKSFVPHLGDSVWSNTNTIKSIEKSVLVIELSARIQSYVKLLLRLLIFILFFFQIPFFFIIFYYNQFCSGYDLSINRKLYFFSCILFSALISPPDILSQSIIICVFLILFEFLIFLGLVFHYSWTDEKRNS